MKRAISIILSLLMMFSLTLTGCAAEETTSQTSGNFEIILQIGNPVMTVNGTEKEIDPGMGTAPVVINDRTLLPVRAVVEEMGGTVGWNGDKQEVTLSYNNDEIKLTIDSPTAYLNGIEQTLDTAPVVINDRTMLPIRFIAESFKFDVDWAQDTQTVTITKASQIPEQTVEPSQPQTPAKTGSNSLVVYFSATGNTKTLAEKIAALSGSDIYEIVPETPYTSADLNYNDSNSRSSVEMNDASARPAISGSVENIESYDTIFIGYPIWWGNMPRIINTFIDTYDLSGKTVMPFCTSASSGISSSVSALRTACPNSDVKDGFRGTSSTSDAQIEEWFTRNGFVKLEAENNLSVSETKIKISWADKEVIIALEDNGTTKDFLSKLPMTTKLEDYNNTEKISRLSEEIYKDNSARGCEPEAGDVALYAPWGNLSIFYKEWSYSNDLIPMGHIESGLDSLMTIENEVEVTIDLLD